MTTPPRIALLNPNIDARTTAIMVGIARDAIGGSAYFDGRTVPFGPPVITTPSGLDRAAREVLEAGRILHVEGFDGILIAGFGDPGLAALRAAVTTPITGIAEAALGEAAAGGRRYAIVTTTPHLRASIEATAHRYGFGQSLGAVRITPGAAEETMSDPDRLAAALLKECLGAVAENGAEAIVIGGGPLALAADRIAPQVPVAIVNPVAAGARLALDRAQNLEKGAD